MKKKIPLVLVLLLSSASLFAGVFSDYDFTFYKTISQPLTTFNSSKIGFDYTGFGFIGKMKPNGMFVRFGFQTPYSILDTIKNNIENKNAGEDVKPDDPAQGGSTTDNSFSDLTLNRNPFTPDKPEVSVQDFSLVYIMGPAARIITSDFINAYAGVGVRVSQNITYTTDPINNKNSLLYKTGIGFDLDIGSRIDLTKRTSLRIGLYATTTLMTFSYLETSSTENGKRISTPENASVYFDILDTTDSNPPLTAHAYISLGKHFSNTWKNTKYRYEITSPELFTGTRTVIE